jgi:hypothetical protein
MNKRKRWRFSQGGGALFVLLLLLPLFVGLIRRWPTDASPLWAWPVFVLLVSFLSVLIWFVSLRPLIRQRLWTFARTWYEGCLGIAFLYIFYALFVFATGNTPSRFHSHPVPRGAGVIFLYWAAIPLLVGIAFYVYDKYRMPKLRPGVDAHGHRPRSN